MSAFSLSDDLDLLERLADAAREPALRWFRQPALAIDNKLADGFDPVTAADRGVEAAIREILAEARPEDGIFGEEYGRSDGSSGRSWVIDPIDGTRAYVAGTPTWGVLIALNDGSGPIAGVMAQPFTGERFIGAPPDTALWRRGEETRPLATRRGVDLSEATLFTTDPGLFTAAERPAFEALQRACRQTRYGMDCYGYALVAAGCADLVVESGLSAYDIQALIPIVRAAGGIVTNWRGESADSGGRVIAAGDDNLHARAVEYLAAAL